MDALYVSYNEKTGVLCDDEDNTISIVLGTDRVVVSRPSTRKGAATLATQQSLASSKGVCHKMYTFRSSMNEGELGDKYKAMVGTMDVLKPDWDRISKKRRKRI